MVRAVIQAVQQQTDGNEAIQESAGTGGLFATFDKALASFPPAYFALVMATGVLAVGC